jgi:hypothetical protein
MPPYEIDYGIGAPETKKEDGSATPAAAATATSR